MSNDFNRELAVGFIQALSDKRTAEAMAMVHEDCYYWIIGDKEMFPFAGEYDKAHLESIMAGSMEVASGENKLEILGTTSEGGRVAVETKSTIPTEDGGIYEQSYHFLFEVKDEKLIVIKEYLDTLKAMKTFGSIADREYYSD